jgi:hypothetical protein
MVSVLNSHFRTEFLQKGHARLEDCLKHQAITWWGPWDQGADPWPTSVTSVDDRKESIILG